jgi:hypothetical protein
MVGIRKGFKSGIESCNNSGSKEEVALTKILATPENTPQSRRG